MTLFLLTFFLLYGSLHFYFFLKLRAAFAPGAIPQTILAALLVLGLIAPVLVRALERLGSETPVRLLSWAGYVWMGILLLFFSAALLMDLYRLVVHTAGIVLHADLRALVPAARTLFLLPLVIALLIGGYGLYEARQIRAERI